MALISDVSEPMLQNIFTQNQCYQIGWFLYFLATNFHAKFAKDLVSFLAIIKTLDFYVNTAAITFWQLLEKFVQLFVEYFQPFPSTYFFKKWNNPGLFLFIFVFCMLHIFLINWWKHRWCALDSNLGWQDGKRCWIHWAMVAPLKPKLRQSDLRSCLPEWISINYGGCIFMHNIMLILSTFCKTLNCKWKLNTMHCFRTSNNRTVLFNNTPNTKCLCN